MLLSVNNEKKKKWWVNIKVKSSQLWFTTKKNIYIFVKIDVKFVVY